eukprot:gene4676-8248_t
MNTEQLAIILAQKTEEKIHKKELTKKTDSDNEKNKINFMEKIDFSIPMPEEEEEFGTPLSDEGNISFCDEYKMLLKISEENAEDINCKK